MARLRFFSVQGEGNFPFEMLWIDQCFPATSHEASLIRLACPTVARKIDIVLATYKGSDLSYRRWTEANWPVQLVE